MANLTLYRKYRPQSFAEIVNQEHVKLTIQQEIISGSLSHAFLFYGPRGIGKTTTMLEYTKRHKAEYDSIIMINECDMKSTFYNNLRLLAQEYFHLKNDEELTNEEIEKLVLTNLKQKTYGNLLLIFDNVDTNESISYIQPFVQELYTYHNYAHIIVTTRIQGAKLFSRYLLPKDHDDVFNISLCMYPLQKLSFFASCELMVKRLKLDESEILQLSEKDGNKMHEIVKIMDGLPLALIQASGALSDDLRTMRIKEGKLLTKANMNQVFDDYVQKYHQDFFNSEHNENYRLDVETNFDDTEFRRNFYEENVQNNPNFQFLEDKIGVTNFEDYLDVLNFSEIDWKEYDMERV